MWRLIVPLLALIGVASARAGCHPSESSKSDLLRATQIVQRLPEAAEWTQGGYLFDTGQREKIGSRCYEAVYVFHILPTQDLDLQHVFAVNLLTGRIFVEDVPPADQFISLKEWRARNIRRNEP